MLKTPILIWSLAIPLGILAGTAWNICDARAQGGWWHNAQSDRCLDADTGTIGSSGTKAQLWDCWGGQNQTWQVNPDGTIVNAQSHRCLDADTGTIGSNGTKVQLWDCWGGRNQNWLIPVPKTWTGHISSPGADTLGVQFVLYEQARALSGEAFVADPQTGAFVELDGLTGSRTAESATWTTDSGIVVTGTFNLAKAQFSGTLQFPLYEGTVPLVAQLDLNSTVPQCPPPTLSCVSGCCQP